MELLTASGQPIRIAIISDVHAYSKTYLEKGEQPPSYVDVAAPSDTPGLNPFAALRDLIAQEELRADILISCGDMGDRAVPDAIAYTWSQIRELSAELGVGTVLATAGNHDLDSRFKYNDHDARSVLQGLPDFPFADEARNNEYWARNLVVDEVGQVRYVVLNSAAYHGYQKEWEHGRVSARTLAHLRKRLEQGGRKDVNVLALHHHFANIGNVDLQDESAIEQGAALLDLLDSGEFGPWLVIHGHRHMPYLSYGAGSAESAVIFSAGSFGAVLYAALAPRAKNQFYILEIQPTSAGRVRGTFTAWDWIPGEGFDPAQRKSGLPHRGGFGSPQGGSALAADIDAALGSRQLMSWAEMEIAVPNARNTIPRDLDNCKKVLSDAHQIELMYAEDGVPIQVGRKS